jgi:hypothetical protein
MSMIRSLHLPGIRHFQPWNRGLHGDGHLTVAAAEQLLQLVRAYTGSGLPGWDSDCRRAVWKNMSSSFPCEARRSPAGAGYLQGHCLTRVALPSRPRDRYAPASRISAVHWIGISRLGRRNRDESLRLGTGMAGSGRA